MTITGQLARYNAACNNLLALFCQKQGFSMADTFWVADQPGTVAACGMDYYFGMDDIIADLEEDAPPGKIIEWYYMLEDLDYRVNYRHWLHGCPTPKKSELEDLHRKAEEARRDLENEIEELTDF